VIEGLSQSEDVLATIRIMRQCGVEIESAGAKTIVRGVGLGGLVSPDDVLYCGNAGTSARLLLGVLASHRLSCTLTGDESLRRRPMGHVMKPLIAMGANFISAQEGDKLPLVLDSSPLVRLAPIAFESPLPSAQLKSAIILAALNVAGETIIIEKTPTRDHTERMLDGFGANIERKENKIHIKGETELTPNDFFVPGDVSSAAFFAALAVMSDKSDITIKNVSVNPHRMGFFTMLKKMGADVEIVPLAEKSPINEPMADIKVKGGRPLSGIDVAARDAVTMIDEYPILSVVAAYASGITNMRGLSQLRVKESNRLIAIADNLNANGVEAQVRGDDLTIIGTGAKVEGGGLVKTYSDHRIAMAFLVQGARAQNPVTIDDSAMIKTSFPDFQKKMTSLGVQFGVDKNL
jgi:3-phosphoshikimate 1-carboxyvinyltransferase